MGARRAVLREMSSAVEVFEAVEVVVRRLGGRVSGRSAATIDAAVNAIAAPTRHGSNAGKVEPSSL